MIAITLSFLAILGLVPLTAPELLRAPKGWEDETGFHFGDAMGSSPYLSRFGIPWLPA